MDIVIAQSAYKHGITAGSMYSCMFNCRSDIMITDPSFPCGIALEIIALEEIERNRLVVIHAMKLRKKYYHLLQEDSHGL